jgi:hypothetical protein
MNELEMLKAELAEVKARQAESESIAKRRIRHLTVTNLVLAVVVLAFGGATAAYALAPANSVNSASIIDRSIGTPDVKVGAFAGQTILDNSMTGADINEATLRTVIYPAAVNCTVNGTGSNDPSVVNNVDCGTVSVNLPSDALLHPVGGPDPTGTLNCNVVVRWYEGSTNLASAYNSGNPFLLGSGSHTLKVRISVYAGGGTCTGAQTWNGTFRIFRI